MINPIEDKIIISTRPEYTEDKIYQALRKEGAQVFQLPMITLVENQLTENDMVLQQLDQYSRIVFTSHNGVKYFFKRYKELFGNYATPTHIKFAVFGRQTYMSMAKYGKNAEIASFGKTSKDLLEVLKTKCIPEERILLALGNLASELLEQGLSDYKVKRINIYQTKENTEFNSEQISRIVENRYDLVLFTSPSGFISFKSYFEKILDLSTIKIACIGETTFNAIKHAGLLPVVVANEPGAFGVTNSIKEYFNEKNNL
ncbi:MAG: uroporphyrinogen-III synthase [Bacteroidales bacterium]|nr:uroporphyrinogen-III synthase [Bacteroidales bacterium]